MTVEAVQLTRFGLREQAPEVRTGAHAGGHQVVAAEKGRGVQDVGVRGGQGLELLQGQAADGPDGYDPRKHMRNNAQQRAEQMRRPRQRKLLTLEKRSLDVLNLPYTARGAEIKARYKELVKLNHPDANGGDRSSEDRLREIIQAYNVLKKAGFL